MNYIEFYGKRLDAEIDKKLYSDSNHMLSPYTNLFKDTNYFFPTLRNGFSSTSSIKFQLTGYYSSSEIVP